MVDFQGFSKSIAREAGELLVEHQDRGVAITHKSNDIDLVTTADRASEKLLASRIRDQFPDHLILGEEEGESGNPDSDLRWVIDPLDGTVNFAHGQPHFCVLVSLERRLEGSWESIACATFDPRRDEMFSAAKGEGAWLNGRALQVSSEANARNACGATGFPYGRLDGPIDNHREFCALSALTRGLRRNGAAGLDLAWLAAGRFDFYWEYDLSRWDESGGILLVREAGGLVSSFEPPQQLDIHTIVASNGILHEPIKRVLMESRHHEINSRDVLRDFMT